MPAGDGSSVLIVGAGPAGLEAAHILGKRGYAVTLADAAAEAGGRVSAREPPAGPRRMGARARLPARPDQANGERLAVPRQPAVGAPTCASSAPSTCSIATGARWRRDGIGRWHVATDRGPRRRAGAHPGRPDARRAPGGRGRASSTTTTTTWAPCSRVLLAQSGAQRHLRDDRGPGRRLEPLHRRAGAHAAADARARASRSSSTRRSTASTARRSSLACVYSGRTQRRAAATLVAR